MPGLLRGPELAGGEKPGSLELGSYVLAEVRPGPQGLKPQLISHGLRGPKGPLFHGCAAILELFRSP